MKVDTLSRWSRFGIQQTAAFAVFLVVGLVSQEALAGNTWDGGAGSPFNWSGNANWSGDTQPTYGTLTFSGTVGNTNIMDANRNMNQLNWTGTSAWGMNSSGGATLSLFDNGGTQAKLEAT